MNIHDSVGPRRCVIFFFLFVDMRCEVFKIYSLMSVSFCLTFRARLYSSKNVVDGQILNCVCACVCEHFHE